MSNVITLDKISKSFITDNIKTQALNQIDLSIDKGEYLAITGPSGCGKSTLLSILGLLDTPCSGNYFLSGHDVSQLDRDQRADIRGEHLGFIFQSFNLISDLTIIENVMLPLTYQSKMRKKQALEKTMAVLEKVDMHHRSNHFPSQLSGGQQQRIAIARALVNDPTLILADEPTGNLDSKNAEIILDIFDALHNEGRTIAMVTHDPRSAKRAQRQIELFDGSIVSDRQLIEAKMAG